MGLQRLARLPCPRRPCEDDLRFASEHRSTASLPPPLAVDGVALVVNVIRESGEERNPGSDLLHKQGSGVAAETTSSRIGGNAPPDHGNLDGAVDEPTRPHREFGTGADPRFGGEALAGIDKNGERIGPADLGFQEGVV